MRLPFKLFNPYRPFGYEFRRWLARKLVPKDLTVYCFDGMEEIGGSNAYDPATHDGWFAVKLAFWETSDPSEDPESGTITYRVSIRTGNADASTHQNSGK